MKLKSLLLIALIVCVFYSCTNNDDPTTKTKVPVLANATMALSVQTDIKTKADGDAVTVAPDKQIKSLLVAVFNKGAYTSNGYSDGDLVYTLFISYDNPQQAAIASGKGLLSGDAQLLIVANPESSLVNTIQGYVNTNKGAGHYNLTDVQALQTSLENETITGTNYKGLTMSSSPIDVTFVTGVNYIGYVTTKGAYTGEGGAGQEIYGQNIVLSRTVAYIQLNSLSLTSSSEYTSASFMPTEVFVANVKSKSLVIPISGSIEVAYDNTSSFYWVGDNAWTTAVGKYKTGINAYKADLGTTFIGNPKLDLSGVSTVSFSNAELAGYGNRFFYVYTNQNGERSTVTDSEKNYTLLVIKGDYTYKPVAESDKTVTEKDRYYTVIVNDSRFIEGVNDTADGKHIIRNTKYYVDLIIAGTGSDDPYTPGAFAHVSAKIHVTPWNVVSMNSDVD